MKKPLSLISVAPALRTLTAIVCLLLSSLVCMAQMPDSSAGDAATSAMDSATEEDDGPSAYAYDNLLNFLVTLRYS